MSPWRKTQDPAKLPEKTAADPAEVLDTLTRFIVERSPALQPGDLDPQTPLLSSGILDSLTLIDMVAYVDQVYGVKLADVIELNADSSDTLQQLVDAISG